MPVIPKIEIDYSLCTTPADCKKCLQICPTSVFLLFPLKSERFKETDPKEPGAYTVIGNYLDRCTGCGECIEVCPHDAITITFGAEVLR